MEARKKLLAEIDSTIDQLIQNGETLQKISSNPQYEVEITALEKTQESLLSHLIHLQEHLQDKGKEPPKLDQSTKKLILPLRSRRIRHHKIRSLLS